MVVDVVDIFRIGARNMQNFDLLRACSLTGKPVMLKRGLSATIEEWLLAAEYAASSGNLQHHPVRTGHPDLRDRHPQHPRPVGRQRGAAAVRTCR